MSLVTFSLADGRRLYVNDRGEVSAWQDNNPAYEQRRAWIVALGTIRLIDGRQLYCRRDGWVCVAKEGYDDNVDVACRTWTILETGVIQLADGRQLYTNLEGWVAAERWRRHTNTDRNRNTWSIAETQVSWESAGCKLFGGRGLVGVLASGWGPGLGPGVDHCKPIGVAGRYYTRGEGAETTEKFVYPKSASILRLLCCISIFS